MSDRFPKSLGRSVVVAGGAIPDEWAGADRFDFDNALLTDDVRLLRAVDDLQHRYVDRIPSVFVLEVDPEELNAPETTNAPPYELGPNFTFLRERLTKQMSHALYGVGGQYRPNM